VKDSVCGTEKEARGPMATAITVWIIVGILALTILLLIEVIANA